jgi:hypothetical protein
MLVRRKEVLVHLYPLKQQSLGIRTFVYSTDRTLNPMTYNFTNNFTTFDANNVESTSVHGIGSVWATMLWDLTWAYTKYGYSDNKYIQEMEEIR